MATIGEYLMLRRSTFLLMALLSVFTATFAFGQICTGGNCTAASCGTSDVQACINSTSAGKTCSVPSGTCTWTSGITDSSVTLAGAGAGRVIAVDAETTALTLGTGSKTFSAVANDMGASNYLNSVAPPITTGETLRIMEDGWAGNYMQGTVTSFSGTTLVMNITSEEGTCGQTDTNGMSSNCKRWLITTLPSTVICNNLSSGTMFGLTESTTYNVTLTGFFVGQNTDPRCSGVTPDGNIVYFTYTSGGQAMLVHDNFFEREGSGETIDGDTNRGVVWDNSFVASTFGVNQDAAIRIKDDAGATIGNSWSTVSYWGAADTTGQHSLYFETNDIHAYNNGWTDCDSNCRLVARYNFIDNSGGSTHGADTSVTGMRTMEFYNNAGWFQAYSDGTTANINWWFFERGGSFLFHDNNLPAISSQDWGTKSDINMTVMTLQREDQYPCWGAGFTTAGQYYHAPRQVGFGYVTGAGTMTYQPLGYSNSSTTANGVYVGDSEPAYIWNNTRSMNVNIGDYGLNNGSTSCPSSPTPDSSVNYLISGRDYFNGTAKPGYTPYPYPHPLTQSTGPASPSSPSNLQGQAVPN
jgi:hypothetical protein